MTSVTLICSTYNVCTVTVSLCNTQTSDLQKTETYPNSTRTPANSKTEVEMMPKRSFGPKNIVQKRVYKPCSFALAKTAPRSDVVCRRLPKSSDTGVVVNTKGEEMMTSCRRTASFASRACCSALSLYQALIP